MPSLPGGVLLVYPDLARPIFASRLTELQISVSLKEYSSPSETGTFETISTFKSPLCNTSSASIIRHSAAVPC